MMNWGSTYHNVVLAEGYTLVYSGCDTCQALTFSCGACTHLAAVMLIHVGLQYARNDTLYCGTMYHKQLSHWDRLSKWDNLEDQSHGLMTARQMALSLSHLQGPQPQDVFLLLYT